MNAIPDNGNNSRKKGFTLLEMMITISLIGLITAFGVASYQNSLYRAYEKAAVSDLNIVYVANLLYKAKSGGGQYWTTGTVTNPDVINTNLNIYIVPNNLAYSYASDGVIYQAEAKYPPTGTARFTIRMTQAALAAGTNPCCAGGTCVIVTNACP